MRVQDMSSPLKRLIAIDVYITSKLALCVNSSAPLGFLRPLMVFLEYSCHGIPWIVGTTVAILVSHERRMLENFLNLFAALIFDLFVVALVKLLVRRKRPAHNQMDMFATISVDKHSFPSGHTTRAVMVALFFIDKFDLTGKLKTVTLMWMATVSSSRIFLGRHHVLDVAFGVLIGTIQYLFVINYLWMSEQICMDLLQPIHEEVHL